MMDFNLADNGVKTSSAGKRRTPEDQFHIQYPATRDFFTWVELGCLCRALGFPPDLIRSHINNEIEVQEQGIHVKQLHRMVDLKLLHQPLHRSFNMHTADWNLCVIKKAAQFLHINVLSFEELYSIRVAYATYEASDMKGLNLDKRSLLRTLKMCQRIISPKKLMHRVKHMKPSLEENNRIQLYEFFDLILWCDTAEHGPRLEEAEQVKGKDNELYNMVDFETLLSHQDERQSRVLDERYLAEEWDFGRERLGDKSMFKGEVVYTDQRVCQLPRLHENQLSDEHYHFSRVETQNQKKKYRRLKRAVSQSQRQVYRALAGSVRSRPISAPNLSAFSTARDTPTPRAASVSAVYKSVQRRLHSAPSTAGSKVDISDRPVIPEYRRVHTPSVVTTDDLDDVTLKMQNLEFDICTLESRCQVKKEEEMNFYIPAYQPSVKENSSDGNQPVIEKKKEHWTPEIIDSLVYPIHLPSPHHSNACDARLRGWKPSTHYGPHRILTVPTFDNSPHGRLLAKQRAVMMAPVANMHRNYVIRYTSKQEAREQQKQVHRPCTAPAASPRTPRSRLVKRLGCRSAGSGSPRKCSFARSSITSDSATVRDNLDQLIEGNDAQGDADANDPKTRDDTNTAVPVAAAGKARDDCGAGQAEEESLRAADKTGSAPRASASMSKDLSLQQDSTTSSRSAESMMLSSSNNSADRKREEEEISGLSLRNSRSKVVEVGGMGTIQLLESIQEHDGEDRLGDTSTFSISTIQPDAMNQDGENPFSQKDPAARLPPPQCVPNDNSVKQWTQAPVDSRLPRQDVQRKLTKEEDAMPANQGLTAAADNSRNQRPIFPPFSASTNSKPSSSATQRLKVDKPDTVGGVSNEEKPPLGPPRQQQQQQQQQQKLQRLGSAASSTTVSDSSDSRDPPLTPLMSVTVTIKDKDQRISSNTRLNNMNDSNAGGKEAQSPDNSFKSSSPCVTSTPRRAMKLKSPMSTPRRSARTGSGKNSASVAGKKPVAQGRDHRNGSASSLPWSGGPSASPTPDMKPSWAHDRILAMNSAYEKPREPVLTESGGNKHAIASTEDSSMEDVATWIESNRNQHQEKPIGERKKSIQFSADTKDAEETKPLQKQSAAERLLQDNKFDLDAETRQRFTFNKVTTRRLLERVHDVISPELRTRIRTGNTGLKVI